MQKSEHRHGPGLSPSQASPAEQKEPGPAATSTQYTSSSHFQRVIIAFRLPLIWSFLFCETAWLVFIAPTDITHYQCYALTFWLGSHGATLLPAAQCAFLHISTPQPALHMLPIEYPSLTLIPFSLPLLAPLPYYALTFGLLMLLSAGLIYWLLLRFAPHGAVPLYLLYLCLGACAVLQVRFDVLPAACTLICLLAAERRHWTLAYLALAIGVLLKLYPIVLLPILFIAEQQSRGYLNASAKSLTLPAQLQQGWQTLREVLRWQWKNLLIFFVLVVGIMGGFALLNFHDAILSPFNYFTQRPIQVEALGSPILWAAHFFGSPYHIDYDFGSLNIVNDALTRPVSLISTALSVSGLLIVFWLQWRQRINFAQSILAALCVIITTQKVFSPQYLIWIIPLLAYVGAAGLTNKFWLRCWGVVALLTTFIYIFFYSHLPDATTAPQILQSMPGFFEVVTVRNALLVFTTLVYLCNWFGTRPRTSLPSSIEPEATRTLPEHI